MFAKGYSWRLNIDSSGQAELIIDGNKEVRKQFQVPEEQWTEFQKALTDGRFFELKGEYGEQVPCGSRESITVNDGRQTHTVNVYFVRHSTSEERANLQEASRVLRLLIMVRGWFDEPEAVDLRQFDRAALNADSQ